MTTLTPAQRTIAARMPEDRGPGSLEFHVKQLLEDFGLFGYHPYDSRRSVKGWPDWTILGPGGALFRELKAEAGRLTVEQRRVGSRLAEAGLNWGVWRPAELLGGTIAQQLARIASKQAAYAHEQAAGIAALARIASKQA